MTTPSRRKTTRVQPRVSRTRAVAKPKSRNAGTPVEPADSILGSRKRLGMTRPVFARLAGVSERTLADWESGRKPSTSGARALRQLQSVVVACERVMKPEFVGKWLVTPNEALGGFKAIELIERGETERVLRVLFLWEAGIPL